MLYEVVIDAGETANKCTIAPLSYRSDFRLIRVKGNSVFGPFQSTILLHPEGECLSTLRTTLGEVHGIASIDCVWRRLEGLLKRVTPPLPLLARIPEEFETAYPRSSRQNTDPKGGLATIEAIFIASAFLGEWDLTLLSEYYFGRRFLEINRERFIHFGIHQANDLSTYPESTPRMKHSLQRRKNRGKVSAQ